MKISKADSNVKWVKIGLEVEVVLQSFWKVDYLEVKKPYVS